MVTKEIYTPTSKVNLGYASVDITPPVGIYNRTWGAAKFDTATGVHMPLRADVIYIGDPKNDKNFFLRIQLDFVYLEDEIREILIQVLVDKLKISKERIILTYSHTHATGMWSSERYDLPGGDILKEYLAGLPSLILAGCEQVFKDIRPVEISYSQGWCDMAVNRDAWDEDFGGRVCGFNPGVSADKTVTVGRVTTNGKLYAVFVNYACHPTTLAFENSLISPDYVGPMRQTVEKNTNVPCIFFQGASGNLAPKYGLVGGTKIAERNGRWLGYSVLSALESIVPPGDDFTYRGPVISGATLGIWDFSPMKDEHINKSLIFDGGMYEIGLPRREVGTETELRAECLEWEEKGKQAEEAGQLKDAGDYRAKAERARRWVGRVQMLPEKGDIPYYFSIYRLGDAIWITVNGEPYNKLQTELRRRFPDFVFFISGLEGQTFVNYLLEEESYGKGLYQEEPAVLAKGSLEIVIEKITERLNKMIRR